MATCTDSEFWEAACMVSLQAQGRKCPDFDKILVYLPGSFKNAKAARNRWERLVRDFKAKSASSASPRKNISEAQTPSKAKIKKSLITKSLELKEEDGAKPYLSVDSSDDESGGTQITTPMGSPGKRTAENARSEQFATPKRKCKNVQSYFQDDEEVQSGSD